MPGPWGNLLPHYPEEPKALLGEWGTVPITPVCTQACPDKHCPPEQVTWEYWGSHPGFQCRTPCPSVTHTHTHTHIRARASPPRSLATTGRLHGHRKAFPKARAQPGASPAHLLPTPRGHLTLFARKQPRWQHLHHRHWHVVGKTTGLALSGVPLLAPTSSPLAQLWTVCPGPGSPPAGLPMQTDATLLADSRSKS